MDRYCRQEILDFLPKNFQIKIKNKQLILIGCGGVGSQLAQLLIRGGFLNIIIIDNDKIDITNLNRQAFFEEDLNQLKAIATKKHLLKINKLAKITIIQEIVTKININKFCEKSDLIIDATDSFKIRKLINSYCEKNNKDWIYNGAIKSQAISCIFKSQDKSFNKVFPNNNKITEEKATDVGVLPSTTYLAASLAFNQIIKYFINLKQESKLIKIDTWNNKLFEINLK